VTNGEPHQPKQSNPKSASPNCTTNSETGTRAVIEESDSNYEQSYSTEDATSPPITHQPPPLSSAIARYKHYLKSFYNSKPTPVDDKLFIGPCAQYINLAIIKKEQLSQEEIDEFTRATLHGGVDQILCQKEQVHLKDIFVSKSKSALKCVLVEGPPGIGKSTFAWELCRKWDELETMQQYSLVVLFKLREKRVQNCESLSVLLHHPTDPMLGRAVVDEILEGEGVLLVLDGLDEFPYALLEQDNCLMRQIMSGSCLPKATVVVTSRPSARMSFKLCQPHVNKHIEIIGFTEEDRVKYAESVFRSQPDMLVHFLKYSFSNPVIKTMMYIPLHCAIVAQIYKECGGASKLIPRTMTQLFSALCRSLLRRYLIENSLLNSDNRMPTDFKDLPPDVQESLSIVREIAYDGILSETLVFYKHELPESFKHMGFMNEHRELYVDRGLESSYNFLHLRLQEYLAAWHISQLPSTEQIQYLERELCKPRTYNTSKKFAEVTLFLAGITGLRITFLPNLHLFPNTYIYPPSKVREVGVSPHLCRCLFEAQNKNICQQQLCSSVTTRLNIQQYSQVFTFPPDVYDYDLGSISVMDFYALGYCIAHSRGIWKVHGRSDIKGNGVGAEALEMLVNGMKHESRHHSPTGLITELNFQNAKISIGITWLKELPRPVLSQLSVLSLCHCHLCPKSFELLAQTVMMMPNLHSVDVRSNSGRLGEAVPERFFVSLSSLKQLESLRINFNKIGSQDALKLLTNLIRTSNNLQCLHIGNFFESYFSSFSVPAVLKEVIPSALATRSLQELGLYEFNMADMIQLSFLLSNNLSITSLYLHGELQRYKDCLAYLSQALYTNTSLTSVTANGYYFSSGSSAYSRFCVEETITLLNDALLRNINRKTLKLDLPGIRLPYLYPLQQLAYQLRRGPSGPQLKLKRAQSLPCLSKHSYSPVYEFFGRPQSVRNCSVPDLSLIESISSLHPTLINSFNIKQFYYRFL